MKRPSRVCWLAWWLTAVAGAQPAPPPAGDYFGNSLPGTFGGKPYVAPAPGVRPQQPSMFAPHRAQRRLTTSGNVELGLNFNKVTGAGNTFRSDQYGRDKLFTQQASLLLAGPIWRWANLNVQAQVEQRSFGFNDTRPQWRVFWEDQNNRVSVGDINPSLGTGNSFVPFSRRLRGIEAAGRLGHKLDYVLFGSQVEGSIRNETFAGNGTPGPFFLTYTPIVDGSAVVLLDGVLQQPGYGTTGDYTLNSSSGELTFTGSKIITPANRIEVRYETLRRGSGPKDLLLGTRVSGSPTRWLRLGASYLGQIAGSEGGPSGPVETRVTDTITVPTPSSGPFSVRPKPIIANSETVQVNGLLQKKDADYQINYQTGELQFFQVQPEGTTILVRFAVLQTVDLGAGDRNVYGFDGSATLGDRLNVQFEFAGSQGSSGARSNPFSLGGNYGGSYGGSYGGTNPLGGNTYGGAGSGGWGPSFRAAAPATRQTSDSGSQSASGPGGTAFRVGVGSKLGAFSLQADYRAVSDNFSRIDSTGFFQNERGLSVLASYAPSRRFTLSNQFSLTSRPYDQTTGTGTSATTTRTRVSSLLDVATLNWQVGPRSSVAVNYSGQRNSGGGSGNDLTRIGATAAHSFNQAFSLNLGSDYTTSGSSGYISGLSGAQTTTNRSLSGRAGLAFNARGGRFNSRADYSFAKTRSTVSRNDATNLQFALTWQATRWASLQATHQLANSSSVSLYRRPSTTNRGVFTDGGTTDVAVDPLTGQPLGANTVAGSKTQNSNLSLVLTPVKSINLSTSYSHGVSDTGRLAASVSDNLQANFHWQATERIGVGLGYTNQALRYTDSGNTTSTGTYTANVDWRLSHHADLRCDFQRMGTSNRAGAASTATSSLTGQTGDNTHQSLGSEVRWRLPGSRYSYFVHLRNESSSGGMQEYGRFQSETGWDLKLTDIVGFRLGYGFTSYQGNATQSAGDYTAHSLNASLGARF
jgi:hypothetical protein